MVLILFAPLVGLPQDRSAAQWTVTVTPTLNPLPLGLCGAVQLSVLDASGREPPRNPQGYRISLADFDLTVNSPDGAVVGKQLDRSHWSVCGCPGMQPGSEATITARYPAQSLKEAARVPDVEIKVEATVTVGAAKGSIVSPGCAQVGAATSPFAKPAANVPTTTAADPFARSPAAAVTRETVKSGPVPTGFRLVPGVPIIANLAWDTMPDAVSYSVRRAVGTATPVERVSVLQAGEKVAFDTIPDPRDTYHYVLVVTYADGAFAQSPPVDYISPPLTNPTGFTATHRGQGNVDFTWQPAAGAKRYRLDGPGIPNTGFSTTNTTASYPKIPAGPAAFKLTALYTGNFADYEHPSMASTIVRVLPPHATPWLTKNNGPGSADIFQAPLQSSGWNGEMDSAFTATALWMGEPWIDFSELPWLGLQFWAGIQAPLWHEDTSPAAEAVYGNAVDLGVGRRAQCAQGVTRVDAHYSAGLTTVCYATAHGVVPGQPGFNDHNTITHPEAGVGEDFILSMVIVKNPRGTSFLVFPRNTEAPVGHLLKTVALDTEGQKHVPQVCMSCHGGKYNTKTRLVDGASFLPLDPGLLEFASAADMAAQQEKIRKINSMIYLSDPNSAIGKYINGLYGNAAMVPGTAAKPDYVPSTWVDQGGFYRTVVKPHCAMCHLAAPTSWNFASWGNFKENSALIRVSVCNARTMPHSELQYKSFWTKDTGAVYLPGLLAATLGFESCP